MRILLVDGNNLLYRAHYANLDLQTRTGEKTGVLYGGLSMLQNACRIAGTREVAVFFDADPERGGHREGTFRAALFKEYKAQRKKDESATLAIWTQAKWFVKAMRILKYKTYYVPGVEADDLIGAAVAHLRRVDDVQRVVIYSGDTDYFQLVRGKVRMLKPDREHGGVLYSRKTLQRAVGYDPVLAAHFKAIAGDVADNFKGVIGLGAKAAVRVLASGGTSRTLFADLPLDVQKKAKTEANWKRAIECYTLARIRTDPQDVAFTGAHELVNEMVCELARYRRVFHNEDRQFKRFKKLCKRWELVSFIPQRAEFFT